MLWPHRSVRGSDFAMLIATDTRTHFSVCTTKRWLSSIGRWHGGKPITQKYIYGILTNPVFIGKITLTRGEETEVYDGRHVPIVDRKAWDHAHRFIEKRDRASCHRWLHPHLLKGKLRTDDGHAMSPTSTHRPLTKKGDTKQKRLVRYYISQKAIKHGFKSCPIKSINAEHLDDLVRGVVLYHLNHETLGDQTAETRDHWIRTAIDSVALATDRLTVRLDTDQLVVLNDQEFKEESDEVSTRPTCLYKPAVKECGQWIDLVIKIQIKKLDGRRMLLSPDGHDLVIPARPEPKQHIVDAISLAYRWHDELVKNGQHISDYSAKNSIARTRILKLLPLVNLCPDVLRHALVGTLASSITLDDLLEAAKTLDWQHQSEMLGLNHAATLAATA
jgi:site-specific DNA recombinase